MSPNRITSCPARQPSRQAVLALIASLLIAGCASPHAPSAEHNQAPLTPAPVQSEKRFLPPATPIPVIRQGRYTLVELTPRAGQRELLQQLIWLHLPGTLQATVGEALQHALLRSGYTLCAPTLETRPLYALPLPAAHYELGPMTLRDALTTLAGPSWTLSADERLRQVCFSLPQSAPAEQAVATESQP